MRFSDFLRTTVLISAAAASLLGAVTLAGTASTSDDLLVPVAVGWWVVARPDRAVASGAGPRPRRRSRRCWPAPACSRRCPRSTRPGRCSTACGRCCCSTLGAGAVGFALPQVPAIAAGFAIIWALAWRRQASARDGDRGARRRALLHRAHLAAAADQAGPDARLPLQPARAQRRLRLGAAPAARSGRRIRVAQPRTCWSCAVGDTTGWRAAARELIGGARARRGTGRSWPGRCRSRTSRTFMLTDFVEARAARRACERAIAAGGEPAGDHLLLDHRRAAVAAPGRDLARRDRRREPARPPRDLAARVERRRLGAGAARADDGGAHSSRSASRRTPDDRRGAGRGRALRAAATQRARHRCDHLRRRSRSSAASTSSSNGLVSAPAAHGETLVVAGLDRLPQLAGRPRGVRFPGACRRPSTARSCAARACSSPRRAARTTGSRPLEALADGCMLVTTPAAGPVSGAAIWPASSTRGWSPRTLVARLCAPALDDPRRLRRARRAAARAVQPRRRRRDAQRARAATIGARMGA